MKKALFFLAGMLWTGSMAPAQGSGAAQIFQ